MCVLDSSGPSLVIENAPLMDLVSEARARGVRLRYLTEITPTSNTYCKKLINAVDVLNHFDSIKVSYI